MSAPRICRLAAAICAVIATAPTASAEEQLVYWPFVTDGTEYRRIAYPQEAGDLVALAGSQLVIEARQAGVSYWPITREFVTEIGQGTPVTGTLEVVGPNNETVPVREDLYTVWYPLGIGAGPVHLVQGADAETLHKEYVAAARSAVLKDQEYQRIVAEHQAAAEAWLKMAATRARSEMPPPPPELKLDEPAPFNSYASEPRKAAIVNLPEGSYRLLMRDQTGNVIAGSERTLKIIAPLDQSVGYIIRPEDRWTLPLASFSPQDTLYTTARTDLFLQPVPVVEYAARDFTRIFQPQSIEAADTETTIWVPRTGDARTAQAVRMWQGGKQIGSIPKAGYRVNQLGGTGRGYTIDAFSPDPAGGVAPDFAAVRLESNAVADRIDVAGSASETSSDRAIVKVDTPPLWAIPLAALIPLLFGIGKRVWGRRFKKFDTRIAKARRMSADLVAGTENKNTVSSFVQGRT
jgi:hypothetical protein